MGKPYKYTRETLEPAVAASTSVAGVLRYLGLRANGGTHAHVSRMIKRFELDTSHFVRWRSKFIPHNRLSPEEILVWRAPGQQREKPQMLTRALLESGVVYECAVCGVDGSWCGQPLSLDVDHIDGDFLNNLIGNLRFLCPNCHRQTPNFAGRSRGRFTQEPERAAPDDARRLA